MNRAARSNSSASHVPDGAIMSGLGAIAPAMGAIAPGLGAIAPAPFSLASLDAGTVQARGPPMARGFGAVWIQCRTNSLRQPVGGLIGRPCQALDNLRELLE